MEENKGNNIEETKVNGTAEAGQQEIVIQDESLGKKILKGVVKGLVIVATGVAGFFLGRASKGSNDSDDSASEGPKAT